MNNNSTEIDELMKELSQLLKDAQAFTLSDFDRWQDAARANRLLKRRYRAALKKMEDLGFE